MASWLLQEIFKNPLKGDSKGILVNVIRHSSKVKQKPCKPGSIRHKNLIQSSCESLAARGFLRSYKPYTPQENVTQKFTNICEGVLGTSYNPDSPLSREDKYLLLNTCFKEFNYSVPNSILHKIVSVNDALEFYQTPVSTTTPYDEFKKQDLPPNLHIQYEYVRFDPDTDSKFNGVSAFPRSSTVVTGLKYKEKYSDVKAKSSYLDTEAITDEDYKNM